MDKFFFCFIDYYFAAGLLSSCFTSLFYVSCELLHHRCKGGVGILCWGWGLSLKVVGAGENSEGGPNTFVQDCILTDFVRSFISYYPFSFLFFVVYCRDDLRNLIIKRIGADNLLDKISFISKSEFFTAAVKSPEVRRMISISRASVVCYPDHGVFLDLAFNRLKLTALFVMGIRRTTCYVALNP